MDILPSCLYSYYILRALDLRDVVNLRVCCRWTVTQHSKHEEGIVQSACTRRSIPRGLSTTSYKHRYHCMQRIHMSSATQNAVARNTIALYPWGQLQNMWLVISHGGYVWVWMNVHENPAIYHFHTFTWPILDSCQLDNGDVLVTGISGTWSVRHGCIVGPAATEVNCISGTRCLIRSMQLHVREVNITYGGDNTPYSTTHYLGDIDPMCMPIIVTADRYITGHGHMGTLLSYPIREGHFRRCVIADGVNILRICGPIGKDYIVVVYMQNSQPYALILRQCLTELLGVYKLPYFDEACTVCQMGPTWVAHSTPEGHWEIHFCEGRLSFEHRKYHEPFQFVSGHSTGDHCVVCNHEGDLVVLY